jgi:hypothetical protein
MQRIDQIESLSDMVRSLLLRLGPSPLPSLSLSIVVLPTVLPAHEAFVVISDLFVSALLQHEWFTIFFDFYFRIGNSDMFRHKAPQVVGCFNSESRFGRY